jgi:hypothetical protein
MKIIFLDIDGVLNDSSEPIILPECARHLNRIVIFAIATRETRAVFLRHPPDQLRHWRDHLRHSLGTRWHQSASVCTAP